MAFWCVSENDYRGAEELWPPLRDWPGRLDKAMAEPVKKVSFKDRWESYEDFVARHPRVLLAMVFCGATRYGRKFVIYATPHNGDAPYMRVGMMNSFGRHEKVVIALKDSTPAVVARWQGLPVEPTLADVYGVSDAAPPSPTPD